MGRAMVHVDPPLRRHCDRQPVTLLERRDVRAGNVLDAGAGQGQDTQMMQGVCWQWAGADKNKNLVTN